MEGGEEQVAFLAAQPWLWKGLGSLQSPLVSLVPLTLMNEVARQIPLASYE